jgi:hypothetical protein
MITNGGKGVNMETIECLDDFGDGKCSGAIEYRMALSATGRSFPRCDLHWDEALTRDEELRVRYPIHAPDDFDPYDAGERWGDDY